MSTTSTALHGRSLTSRLGVMVALSAIVLSACGSRNQPQAGAPGAAAETAQTGSTEPVSSAPAEPALAVTQDSWTPDALQKLVAPIALYPDQLVGQILAASVNSQEVLDGGNWLLQNEGLKGDALSDAAQKAGLGPAMQSLVHFPSVVDMMCQEIDWTRQLGTAFTSDQKSVLEAVQTLRAQAAQVGNLKTTPQQKVETRTEDNKQVIVIQPADPQVVYVPQYNPTVIYTTPPPPAPAVPAQGTVSTGTAVAGSLIAFGVGALVGSAIASNNCYPHWGAGAVYVGPRPFYPPAYVYRPVYGPAFRPATGYVPPPGYRYSYNNVNVNRNVNVNVNNNYFNQYNHNQNLSGATSNTSWKGQTTYAGSRATPAQQARFNEATGRPANAGLSGSSSASSPAGSARNSPGNSSRQNQSAGAGGTRNPAPANNRGSSGLSQSRAPSGAPGSGTGPPVDRGFGSPARGAAEPASPGRLSGDSAAGGNRNAGGSSRPGQSASGSSPGQRDHAFTGATEAGGGGFARAASARGNASAGGAGRAGGLRKH